MDKRARPTWRRPPRKREENEERERERAPTDALRAIRVAESLEPVCVRARRLSLSLSLRKTRRSRARDGYTPATRQDPSPDVTRSRQKDKEQHKRTRFLLEKRGVLELRAHERVATNRGLPPTTGTRFAFRSLLITQSFQVRFGRSRVPTTPGVRGSPEHSRSSLASTPSLNHSQTPNVESQITTVCWTLTATRASTSRATCSHHHAT